MTLDELLNKVKNLKENRKIVIAHAIDESLFLAAKQAIEEKLASFVFIGPLEQMERLKEDAGFTQEDDKHITWVDAESDTESAKKAVQLVSNGEGDVLMKGMLSTSKLLKAVLHKEYGLRSGKILSHIAGFSIPNREKILFLSDAAMNINPTLQEKVQILQNAVDVVNRMGLNEPKVAAIAAVETVNPAMEATTDAASLTMMNRRGQITNCIVDGPLGLDNAISKEAAKQKGITSEVGGSADILIVPTIEVGNTLYKSLTYFGGATVGGMIIGAKAPIVLTSRADSVQSKLFSMAMAVTSS
ncbi:MULTISPECIES: bifunctional enoyl-CoA hydratase/phosphate acetyltransferase [Bacillaceae]|uniref:Bifunctional enoyl-CoA hydratase/phosphate acetyltransferase n=1 Tax=Evansella alkalicola TaxID=745819 RepID=A0ABS6K1B6_9BACI|nr:MULTISPECIES: bifunctional enoyl-CoA hydratase/phosphate acetyltransferase [Bacillaceae]MBU9724096.1 bifunctional enoyl-CoA hydratase/phosphate acetyltransferase [Bacillus alkalicola]